jgi:hypothetical protein
VGLKNASEQENTGKPFGLVDPAFDEDVHDRYMTSVCFREKEIGPTL